MKYSANFNYFDKIDTPDKAYWLGFIWADGYVAKRDRGNRIEYNLKLAVGEADYEHMVKFTKSIESDYPVHIYKSSGFDNYESKEARVFITNKHMGSLLYDDLGIKPRRSDPTKIINHVPETLHKYFILGLFDADGSFTAYQGDYGEKLNVTFGGSVPLLRFVETHIIKQGLVEDLERKVAQRHEGKDGTWRSLRFAGKRQGMKILNYLYKDSPIYLDRKYEKYLAIPYHNE